MKKLILLLSLVFIKQTNAQPYVLIPDVNFANYLQVLIPTAMHGDSLNTSSTCTVVTTMGTLNVSSRSISNLFGVQYFTSLTNLSCSANSLTSLPTLPNSLTYLDCSTNFLTSLPTLPNSLQYLGCHSNSLTNLPTLPNSLVFLGCFLNSLTSLPSLPNSLQTLYCYNNSLTSLPTLPNSLLDLYCATNNISCFPIFPTSLNSLTIDPNPYNCLPNHIAAMNSTDLAVPLCAAGNSHGCPVANSIEQFNSNLEVTIYPNPTSDQFFIEANTTDKLNVDLYDVNGRHVFSSTVMDKSNINVATLDNGAYTLTIKTPGRIINKKLIILR